MFLVADNDIDLYTSVVIDLRHVYSNVCCKGICEKLNIHN